MSTCHTRRPGRSLRNSSHAATTPITDASTATTVARVTLRTSRSNVRSW